MRRFTISSLFFCNPSKNCKTLLNERKVKKQRNCYESAPSPCKKCDMLVLLMAIHLKCNSSTYVINETAKRKLPLPYLNAFTAASKHSITAAPLIIGYDPLLKLC
jgi:hypothetical protein